MIGHDLKVSTPDGDFMTYLVVPEGAKKAPVVVVIQEIFGINANIRAICHDLAGHGFIAAAPDLFWRQEPGVQLTDKTQEEWNKAFAFYKGFNVETGIQDIQATIDAVRGHAHSNGKVGAIGYCLGGLLAYLTAARTNIDASVGYYGVGIETKLEEAAGIKKPLMLHIAALDEYCKPPAQEQIKAAFTGSSLVKVHIYDDVDHGFARIDGIHEDKAAAALANGRSRDFLKAALA